MTSKSRSSTYIWLIGQQIDKLNTTKLPTKKEAMCLFMYYKNTKNQTIREALTSCANDVLDVWCVAAIPTTQKCHVVEKLNELFTEWQNLKKSKGKKSKSSRDKEYNWEQKLDALLDIAHANANELITVEEDKVFLQLQREGGKGKIMNIDKSYKKRQDEMAKKQEKMHIKKIRESSSLDATVLLASSSSSCNSPESSSGDDVNFEKPSTSKEGPLRKRMKVMNEHLLSSLDVAKISDRSASSIIIPTIANVGIDPDDYNISYSSIRRARQKSRQKFSENLKKELHTNKHLTVHWDGKLLEDITGNETVDRLPIFVSGSGEDQLLGVPKIDKGTGKDMANAVVQKVTEWNIIDKVKGLCFDTTASNTGRKNGACVLIEQIMEKDLLWYPCRHHILEIILESVVSPALQASSGPDLPLFKRFRTHWITIDTSSFEILENFPQNEKKDIIKFALTKINEDQPRDDYKELLELTILLLGSTPPTGIRFKKPGAYHRARWMAKAIYCIKIFMFKRQFKIKAIEEKKLEDVCLFIVSIYIRHWFSAPNAASAPRNDLTLLKSLHNYKSINAQIADAALHKVKNHLWYLSEELIALSFFDDEIGIETKEKMKDSLEKPAEPGPPKKIQIDLNTIINLNIEDFVTINTKSFFSINDLPSEFLHKPVEDWPTDETFLVSKNIVHHLKVVNDIAERGVKLIQDYNKLITNDEQQKQYLLQVVSSYRKKLKDKKKSTLVSMAQE